jgi:dihydroorotate dehydrogenase electron transfer subunit
MKNSIINHGNAEIISNACVGHNRFKMGLRHLNLAKTANPGQFVHIRINCCSLLRRPFSINDVQKKQFYILYEIKGQGTEKLSLLKPGESVDVIGPLGKGFDIDLSKKEHLMVAGGMGLAPMNFLFRRLKLSGLKHELLYGCRNASELLPHPRNACCITSDDGSFGKKGFVTSLLEEKLCSCENPIIYACGPWPMLKAVAKICHKNDITCQVSLESFMACGVGACQGCVVKGSDGAYISVCDKGPVFDGRSIDWEQECTI